MTPGIAPMLPRPGPVPQGPGWTFEFAWDGMRSLAGVESGGVRLVGGDGRAISTSYPELDALPALTGHRRLLLDGKIVALDACGRPSFPRLQQRMNVQRPSAAVQRRFPVVYYVFDVLQLDDHPVLELPYRRRRELLAELSLAGGPVVVTPCFPEADGQLMLDTAAEYRLSGVIAKRADSGYQPGRRSRSWVATALRHTQEVVVGGWLPGRTGSTGSPGSLLVGVPTERGLRYAGQVGTGFTDAGRRELADRLAGLARSMNPFLDDVPKPAARHAQWVAPELLGEVSYRHWTAHGCLGHPTWLGLRRGKHPAAIRGPVFVPGGAPRKGVGERDPGEAVRPARAGTEALRNQFSPHFLYNALTTISALVRTEPARARELLAEFAGFTRYTFRTSERSTLGDELENIERYLALEHARLDERLQVTLQAETAVLPVALPSLVLQLLVGNAVRNGIEEEPDGGTVAISAVEAGSDCVITVSDDGPGAAPDLGDLDERLRAVFGDRYDLAVDRSAGAGTTVRLRVPTLL
jgi:DNA ligase D-like protein (predicted ligase)